MNREELSQFDGKDGRRAYIGYKGFVYDITDSKMWKGGQHVKRHFAGKDLTADIAAAPHTEEVFKRFQSVDVLTDPQAKPAVQPEETRDDMLRRLYKALHPHPMFVHFPMGLLFFAAFLQLLYLYTDMISFEQAAFYCLVGGGLALIPAILSGFFSWWLNFNKSTSKIFRIKITCSVVLLITCFLAVWLKCPVVPFVSPMGAEHIYSTLLFINIPLLVVIGFNGGKITWG